jgi:UMF1 family MFS transporter
MITLQKAIKADQCMGLYDWANSVYSLVIATAVFPIYYETVTSSNNGVVQFRDFNNSSLYYHTPFHSFNSRLNVTYFVWIADYTGKKRFMKFFLLSGVFSVMSLFFLRTRHLVDWVLGTVLASIGFWEVSFL